MGIAVLYDIHANLPALEAVLAEVRDAGVDRIVVGGDVLPGPMPSETLACLLELDLPVTFIMGNGDREVLARRRGIETGAVPAAYREAMDWNAAQLRPGQEDAIAGWPATVTLDVPALGGTVLFCHATPSSDTDIFTRVTPDERLRPAFAAVTAPLVVCGHTHMAFDRTLGSTRIVTAGSVGMPFGDPGAHWLLLGDAVEFRHTRYDLPRAADRIRATAYPQAAEFAARNVLDPPTEDAMLAVFGRSELA